MIYQEASHSLEPFAPKGEPQNLNREGASPPEAEADVNAALAAFAPIRKAWRLSSITSTERVSIPTEGWPSIYNAG
jgi:hypothetical protein